MMDCLLTYLKFLRLDIIIFIDITLPIMMKKTENTNMALTLKPDLGLDKAETVIS